MAKEKWSDFKKNVSDVLDAPQNGSPDIPTIIPAAPKTNIWLIALLVLAVSLGITIFFSRSNTELNTDRIREVQRIEPKVDELQSLKQDVEMLRIKVRILGSLANNNAVVNQENPSIVFIVGGEKPGEWKLSQIPPNLQKTEADFEFFQKWAVK